MGYVLRTADGKEINPVVNIIEQYDGPNISVNATNATYSTMDDYNAVVNAVSVEYGRIKNDSGSLECSYYMLRIPRQALNGKKIYPHVAFTSKDGEMRSAKRSVLNYASQENKPVVINAGLFFNQSGDITIGEGKALLPPEGQTVINYKDVSSYKNGHVWMDYDMKPSNPISDSECYPLLIDKNGVLTTRETEDRTSNENSPAQIIADGYPYAVTAWGRIVWKYKDDSLTSEEIVHKNGYIRQVIGQYQNGDYLIFSCDRTGYSGTNAPKERESGIDYTTLAKFLISKGAKFAYSLDGGGSCQTVLGNRMVNPIFDGSTGRSVPTVIYFDTTPIPSK